MGPKGLPWLVFLVVYFTEILSAVLQLTLLRRWPDFPEADNMRKLQLRRHNQKHATEPEALYSFQSLNQVPIIL